MAFPEGEDQHHYAGGSDAPVNMHIANRGDEPDELVSVSTDVASDVTIEGDATVLRNGALFVVEPGRLDESGETVPAADDDGLVRNKAAVVLNDLEHPVRPAQSVTLTLTFREAGTIEVLAPIAPSPHDRVVEVSDGEDGGGGH
nr:copper chaperone PCu(A)C [Haloechinothrix aidingensis]